MGINNFLHVYNGHLLSSYEYKVVGCYVYMNGLKTYTKHDSPIQCTQVYHINTKILMRSDLLFAYCFVHEFLDLMNIDRISFILHVPDSHKYK